MQSDSVLSSQPRFGSLTNVNLPRLRRHGETQTPISHGTHLQSCQNHLPGLRRGLVLAPSSVSAVYAVSIVRHEPAFKTLQVRQDRSQEQKYPPAFAGNLRSTHLPLYLLPFAVPGYPRSGPETSTAALDSTRPPRGFAMKVSQ